MKTTISSHARDRKNSDTMNHFLNIPTLNKIWRSVLPLCVLGLSGAAAHASQAYGSINNFDAVNDTGVPCHGFEIELEDIRSTDITYTYNWNHYGTPKITEDTTSVPGHTNVIIRYAAVRTNGGWSAYTAVPAGPIPPTQGHQFTNPGTNFGGEHFGAGYRRPPSAVRYNWLVDDGSGALVHGGVVSLATPAFTYFPPVPPAPGVPAVPAQVQALIVPPPPPVPDPLEFGAASWVKEIRTTTHNNNEVKLRDLVSDDPDDPNDKNWRNGEPDEVEVEWQLLQTDYKSGDGGANGHLAGALENLPDGDEVVTRRYEFYKYVGPIDMETGEAMADSVAPNGTNGVGIKTINGVEVDLATVVVVGEYLGAQMSAVDVDSPVGLVDQVQDGVVNVQYAARALVIAGNTVPTSTNWGNLPPGMAFSRISGELSGKPTGAGVFQFTVEARATNAPTVRKTYTLTVAASAAVAAALPPRKNVDTVPAPLDGGITTGDGTYTNGTTAIVTATPAAGRAFVNWTDNGKVVSTSASYAFTNIVNRSLVANFIPAPTLALEATSSDSFILTWSTNFPNWKLQENQDLSPGGWTSSTRPISVVGDLKHVNVSRQPGRAFFRLQLP